MFNKLRNFFLIPEEGINNIAELGKYVLCNWFGLIALFGLAFAMIYLVKLIFSIFASGRKE